jgi:hypothetical protein
MFVRMAILLALQVWLSADALARELSPNLRALIEGFQAHRRTALGYLRTQNAELGAVEIERLRGRWRTDRGRLSAATAGNAGLAPALAATEGLVAESQKAADDGDTERARTLLDRAARPLDRWRAENGIRLFSDCIAEVTAAYEPLDRHRLTRPDLADPSTAERILGQSSRTIAALESCNREATEAVRREPEFRRLVDGMLISLRQMPDAVRARDGAYMHRLLIEQRSFERLLSFRFG